MATRNEKAVALFKEHLPPHIAELCIKEHEHSCKQEGFENLADVECITVEQALIRACFWSTRPDQFIDLRVLYLAVTDNHFESATFYGVYPSLKPVDATPVSGNEDKGVTGDEPFELTVDEMIESHLPIRESELQQSSNSEDKRDAMHSNESPQVEADVVIRDIYKNMHLLFGDLQQQIDRVHYDVVKLRHVPASSVLDRMYDVYANHAKGNDSIWNTIMRRNEDGSMSMYTRHQFASEYTWIMPLLTVLVAEHTGVQIGRNLEVIHNSQTTNRTERIREHHDVKTYLKDLHVVSKRADEDSGWVKTIAYGLMVISVIDIVLNIINLFI